MRTLKAIDWTRSETERNKTKYQGVSYGYTPPKLWKTPPLVFPYTPDEKTTYNGFTVTSRVWTGMK